MANTMSGTFQMVQWDEAPYEEHAGEGKLTRASVKYSYHGALEGEGKTEYLMSYPEGHATQFVGFQRFVGTLNDKKGSFVFQHRGVAETDGTVRDTATVVPGSGTGELRGLQGTMENVLKGQAERYPLSFTYTLEG